MSERQENSLPQLDAVLEALADEIVGWVDGLGIELTYTDPVLDEQGENEWATRLRKATDRARRTAVSLLTAQGKRDLIDDLNHRMDELLAAADAYEQRLAAMEDQRRVHVEGIVSRYRKVHGEEDPDAVRLRRLCRGMKRVWTLGFDASKMQAPAEFAEAIDRAWLEEDGAKRNARVEMQGQARELTEHLRLLARSEAQRAATRQHVPAEKATSEKGRGKRGPDRMPLKQAWEYLGIVQEWAAARERNRDLPTEHRYRKVQLAEKHGITPKELDAMLGWYAKHRREDRFPDDPRTLSKGELEQWFK